MTFLAPLLLTGLAALAVPVLVHLIQRERKTIVPFPSLMFLRQIPYQSTRRRRLRHWSLLALRLAALLFIVAAFARPVMRGAVAEAVGTGARDVVIVLDRSYSMGYADTWDRARAAARQAVEQLAPTDRASLIVFADDAEVAARAATDRGQLLAAIDATPLTAGATRYGSALKLAGSLLAESALPRREVIVISDFQRAGWEPGQALRLPADTVLTPVSVAAAEVTNVAVTPVSLQRELFSGRERVVVSAGILNRGTQPVENLTVTLEVDDKPIETVSVSAGPHGAASFSFPPVTLDASHSRGAVRIGDDRLGRDNVEYFALAQAEPVGVVVVGAAAASRDDAFYLTRALGVGDRPRFEVTTREGADVPADALNRTRVVIVNDTAVPAAVAGRLVRFVERGGGLLLALGPRSSWPERSVLTDEIGLAVDRTRGTPGTLTDLAYEHPVFEPFRAPRSGDFSSARFYGYRGITPAAGAEVLARFEDGAPALVERRVGAGRIIVWASTLDLGWSDLPVKPVFLPFVHRLVRQLAGYRERPTWLTVGSVLELGPSAPGIERSIRTPDGDALPVAPGDGAVLDLREQGFYEVHGTERRGTPVEVVASNVDLAESDFTPLDPQEMVTAVAGGPGQNAAGSGANGPTDEMREREQRIWWYLLFAGILLLTAETWLARQFSRAV